MRTVIVFFVVALFLGCRQPQSVLVPAPIEVLRYPTDVAKKSAPAGPLPVSFLAPTGWSMEIKVRGEDVFEGVFRFPEERATILLRVWKSIDPVDYDLVRDTLARAVEADRAADAGGFPADYFGFADVERGLDFSYYFDDPSRVRHVAVLLPPEDPHVLISLNGEWLASCNYTCTMAMRALGQSVKIVSEKSE